MFKFDVLKKLDKDFIPRYFNSSEIEKLMKENEQKVIILLRSSKEKEAYNNFDNDFSIYLDKLPQSNMKKYVGILFNKNLVYFGTTKIKDLTTVSRVLLTKNEKLAGIVLNSYVLDISVAKGSTSNIDECICGTYLGLIRAAILSNKQEIKKDFELHKLITSFLYLLFLKILGRTISVSSSQKDLLHLICIYLFYRQFMDERHTRIIYLIEKYFVGDLISKESYDKYKESVDKLVPFTSFKDIPRILNDLNMSNNQQQQIMMSIIKYIDKNGFYAIIGSLDNLVAAIILSKYPTELISRGFAANYDIQDKIEKKISTYLDKLSYESQFNE